MSTTPAAAQFKKDATTLSADRRHRSLIKTALKKYEVARDAKKDGRDQHPKVVVGSGVGGAQGFIVEYGLATK